MGSVAGSMAEADHSQWEVCSQQSHGEDERDGRIREEVQLMAKVLTKAIAEEYVRRVRKLPENGMQDIGERRELRLELQKRCGLTDLQAVNIINGDHVKDYVMIAARKERERIRKEGKE